MSEAGRRAGDGGDNVGEEGVGGEVEGGAEEEVVGAHEERVMRVTCLTSNWKKQWQLGRATRSSTTCGSRRKR